MNLPPRRAPERVALILRVRDQYPEAFRLSRPGHNTKGGELSKAADAMRACDLAIRTLLLEGLSKAEVSDLTDFTKSAVFRVAAAWRRMEAI